MVHGGAVAIDHGAPREALGSLFEVGTAAPGLDQLVRDTATYRRRRWNVTQDLTTPTAHRTVSSPLLHTLQAQIG